MRTAARSLLIAAAAVCAAGTLSAQTYRANAKVPFSFEAGMRVMPAGDYQFDNSPMSPYTTVSNRGSSLKAFVAAGVGADSGAMQCVIKFRRYGDHYFLAAVETEGRHNKLPVTKREKEMRAKVPPVEISLAATTFPVD